MSAGRATGARQEPHTPSQSLVRYLLIALLAFATIVVQRSNAAQSVNWTEASMEATRLLQDYVRIDSSNPPGRTTETADFLARLFEAESIPVTRYESVPGKAIIYARLNATISPPAGKPILLMDHMDVVPADRAQWKLDPFSALIQGPELWGRGALDMKGPGIAQVVAFLTLKRQNVARSRDVILLANPDEEVGGADGARWMIANHYAELDPEFVIDEGGLAAPTFSRRTSWSTACRSLKKDVLVEGSCRRHRWPWQSADRRESKRSTDTRARSTPDGVQPTR